MKTPVNQLSSFKRPKTVNYLEGFWAGYFRDILKKATSNTVLSKRPSLKGRFSLRWEHVVIAFLLGLLIMKSAPTHIIRDQIGGFSPAPAIMSIKPLPLLKVPSIKPIVALDTVWVDKRRPAGTYPNDYAAGNCTWYVASRLPIPNSMGNASNWSYAMALAGYTVSSQPKVGAIAQTGGDSSMGHVAIVESLNPDGSFVVSEMNYSGLGVIDTRTTTTAEFPNFIIV